MRGLGRGGLANRRRRTGPHTPRSLPTEVAETIVQHAPLAYERVVGACSSMNCGDMLYRRCAVAPISFSREQDDQAR